MLTGTAAATVVEWSNDFLTLLTDSEGTPLSSGWLGPGDGALLQLGYFDQATDANPFSGNWMVLTFGTIGDKGDRGDGRFVLSGDSVNFLPDVPLPAVGTPLAIRFYDAPIGGTPRFFNTVSNEQGLWNWSDVRVGIKLSDPGAVWEGDGQNAFRTGLPVPVPEPSPITLMVPTMIAFGWKRRQTLCVIRLPSPFT